MGGYTPREGVRHLGPTSQDFRAAFNLGADDEHIAAVDADGVALAAIQALYGEVQARDERIETLEDRVERLEARLARLEQMLLPDDEPIQD